MNWTATTYAVYLLVAVPLTIWVARTLFRNGAVFLADVFKENKALAQAVNNLLVVGFYLLNLGFVILYVRTSNQVGDLTDLFNTLSVKIGIVMLVLGVLHFVNVMVFNGIRVHDRAPRPGPATFVPAGPPMRPMFTPPPGTGAGPGAGPGAGRGAGPGAGPAMPHP